ARPRSPRTLSSAAESRFLPRHAAFGTGGVAELGARGRSDGALGGNVRWVGAVDGFMSVSLGKYGIWARPDRATAELAREAERLGYSAVWVGGSPAELTAIEPLLDVTENLVVATGIINM